MIILVTITMTLLLGKSYNVIVTRSSLRGHSYEVIVTRSLLQSHRYEVIVTRSSLRGHRYEVIVTRSSLRGSAINRFLGLLAEELVYEHLTEHHLEVAGAVVRASRPTRGGANGSSGYLGTQGTVLGGGASLRTGLL